jgi:hypothetical protein
MKALRNGMLTIAALALAGSFAGTANAQAKAAGSFTLPFEAKCGNTVLPRGDYTFSVKSTSGAAYLVSFAAKGRSGETLISVKDLGARIGEKNVLVAVRTGGRYRIRSLHLPIADLVVNFAVPKEERTLIAATPQLVESVPVLVATK